jgi:methionyl-tRNA formyltransferase
VDWSWPAEAIAARVRAFQPWPGTVARLGGRALKLWKARPEAAAAGEAAPGTVVHSGREGIVVACGGGTTLRLLQLQPENGRVMDAAAFAAGARLAAGARFD